MGVFAEHRVNPWPPAVRRAPSASCEQPRRGGLQHDDVRPLAGSVDDGAHAVHVVDACLG